MNTLILAACSCIIYILVHYIDHKIIKKKDVDTRETVKTSALMFASIMLASIVYEQLDLKTLTNNVSTVSDGGITNGVAKVFTDNPGF